MQFLQTPWKDLSRKQKQLILFSALLLICYATFIRPIRALFQQAPVEASVEASVKAPIVYPASDDDDLKHIGKTEILLDVPFIHQIHDLPPLVNGCEVTALAMLLNYYQVEASKNTLAKQIQYVPMTDATGLKGDPNEGFVGSMTDKINAMGVYVAPIEHLAKQYVPEEKAVVASTETDLTQLLSQVAQGNPVWVIGSLDFIPPTDDDFIPWPTKNGDLLVTPLIHSGLIVGFDQKNIYVNDPLYAKNRAINRAQFEATFDKMGRQSLYLADQPKEKAEQ